MRTPLLTVALIGTLARLAVAADQPIAGTKLLLKHAQSGQQKLVFLSKDPNTFFPAIGSSDDPGTGTPGGATVELFSTAEPGGVALAIPSGGGWTVKTGAANLHRFKNPSAPDGPSAAYALTFKEGRVLKVVARSTGLALASPQGAVGVRVTTGSLRNCALFTTGAIVRDDVGSFVARNAAATGLADCSNASLGGVTPTTTIPGVCGDGIVNQASEECDPPSFSEGCVAGLTQCRPPGFATSCQCCLDGGPNVQIYGCCNPSSVLIPAPDSGGTCVATRCDPPFTCGLPNECLPDGSCCTGAGGVAIFTLLGSPILLNACCPDLQTRPGVFGIECCRSTGTCATNAECCSTSCTAGVCDP